jgi:hypothetical protein
MKLGIEEIIAYNPNIDIKKIKEVNGYMNSIRHLIKKEAYDIGVPDIRQDQRSSQFLLKKK